MKSLLIILTVTSMLFFSGCSSDSSSSPSGPTLQSIEITPPITT